MADGGLNHALYSASIRAAGIDAFRHPVAEREGVVFAHWVQMIHTMLLTHGCPCMTGDDAECFLHLAAEKQRITFKENELSFEEFLSIISEGISAFTTAD